MQVHRIRYCNTDLDLVAPVDLGVLMQHLQVVGLSVIHTGRDVEGSWLGSLELQEGLSRPPTDTEAFHEVEQSIITMLDIVERLEGKPMEMWRSCTKIEFNVGFDCGQEPWAFNRAFSPELLRRMAGVGAGLRITLYPQPPQQSAASLAEQ